MAFSFIDTLLWLLSYLVAVECWPAGSIAHLMQPAQSINGGLAFTSDRMYFHGLGVSASIFFKHFLHLYYCKFGVVTFGIMLL